MNLHQKLLRLSPCVLCQHTGASFLFFKIIIREAWLNFMWQLVLPPICTLAVISSPTETRWLSWVSLPVWHDARPWLARLVVTSPHGRAAGSVSTLLNLFFSFPCFLPASRFHIVANPLKVCSIKKSQKCELDANRNLNFVAQPPTCNRTTKKAVWSVVSVCKLSAFLKDEHEAYFVSSVVDISHFGWSCCCALCWKPERRHSCKAVTSQPCALSQLFFFLTQYSLSPNSYILNYILYVLIR